MTTRHRSAQWALVVAVIAGCKEDSAGLRTPLPPTKPWGSDLREPDRGAPLDPHLLDRLRDLAPRSRPPPALVRKHRAGDCSPAYAPRPDRDPNPLCKIAGGSFGFGADATPVTVRPFLIDQFEVSAAQAAHFLNARGSNECPGLDRPPSFFTGINECVSGLSLDTSAIREVHGAFEVVSGFERTPASWFTWEGAMQYCGWVGKQVPSSAQWEFAARHDPRSGRDLRFPWGDAWKPNASCWHLAGCRAPDKPAFGASWIGMFDGTRGRGDGSSPWGVHDLVGGAAELMFLCADPEDTCRAGEPCPCKPQSILQDSIDEHDLELTARVSSSSPFGFQGLRCALIAKSEMPHEP